MAGRAGILSAGGGVEIREEQFEKTKCIFEKKDRKASLIQGDVLCMGDKYDGVFSTGLIQCLDPMDRNKFLKHVAQLAPKAVFTVPIITCRRNENSKIETAVAGCPEYETGNIPYELSEIYNNVRVGVIDKKMVNTEDMFAYYICSNK